MTYNPYETDCRHWFVVPEADIDCIDWMIFIPPVDASVAKITLDPNTGQPADEQYVVEWQLEHEGGVMAGHIIPGRNYLERVASPTVAEIRAARHTDRALARLQSQTTVRTAAVQTKV